MFHAGDQIIPGFKLEAFLGKGEFGEVWRTTSPGGNRLAMKFLDLSEKQGRKEFRAVQRIKGIRHPNLVMTYAMWLLDDSMKVIEDTAFEMVETESIDPIRGTLIQPSPRTLTNTPPRMLVIATALCDQNLMERLKDCQRRSLPGIPNTDLLQYMSDAAKAIDFLNAPRHDLTRSDPPLSGGEKTLSSIHHCDIKPANIMLVGDSAVVGDFGVARVLGSRATFARSTQLGGSVAYAPPEIFENRSESTTDQYSLAITYYELRTGKLPFDEHSVAQVVRDKTSGKLDFSLVPKSVRKVLRRATAVNPKQRFASSVEFVDQLAVASQKTKSLSSTTRLTKGLVALVFLASLGGLAWKYNLEIEAYVKHISQYVIALNPRDEGLSENLNNDIPSDIAPPDQVANDGPPNSPAPNPSQASSTAPNSTESKSTESKSTESNSTESISTETIPRNANPTTPNPTDANLTEVSSPTIDDTTALTIPSPKMPDSVASVTSERKPEAPPDEVPSDNKTNSLNQLADSKVESPSLNAGMKDAPTSEISNDKTEVSAIPRSTSVDLVSPSVDTKTTPSIEPQTASLPTTPMVAKAETPESFENDKKMPLQTLPKIPISPELSKTRLADRAFEMIDQDVVSDSNWDEAIQMLTQAVKLGYQFEPLKSIGNDIDDLQSNGTFSNLTVHADNSAFIKIVNNTLHCRPFANSSVCEKAELAGIEQPIVRVAWSDTALLLQDRSNLIWTIPKALLSLNGDNVLIAKELTPDRLLPGNEAYWVDSGSNSPLFFAVKKPPAFPITIAGVPKLSVSVYRWTDDSVMQPCEGFEKLPIRNWPPFLVTDASQSKLFVADSISTANAAFDLFDATNKAVYSFADSIISDLQKIEQAEFIQDGSMLLLRGRHSSDSNEHAYLVRFPDNSTTQVTKLQRPYGPPKLLLSDQATGFISLFDQTITQTIYSQEGGSEREIAEAIQSIESGTPTRPFAASDIQCMVVTPRRWLAMATNRSSIIFAKLFDEERMVDQYESPAYICVELPWQTVDEPIVNLQIAGNYILATTNSNVTSWYSLNQVLAIAESWSQATR